MEPERASEAFGGVAMSKNEMAAGGTSSGQSEKRCDDDTPCLGLNQEKISGYEGVSPVPTRELSWPEALEEIRSGKYRTSVLAARKNLATGGKDAYAAHKRRLPGVSFGGAFSHRKNDGVLSATGFIVADIDGCDVCQVKEALAGDGSTWFGFTSPGGEGIKAGLRAQGIKSDSDHKRFFSAVEKYFSEVYNITIDRACKDISRLTFLSYDPGAFINPDPAFFDIDAWAAESAPSKTRPQVPSSSNGGSKTKYARKVLETACQKIMQSTPGTMHATRLAMAVLAGGYLHYGISDREALGALETAVAASGTTDFTGAMKTIRDGLEHGRMSPVTISPSQQQREVPPLPPLPEAGDPGPDENPETKKSWLHARELMPRVPYPWDALPPAISNSLHVLARASPSNSAPLPGFACAFIGGAVGRTVGISVKAGWVEPLVSWFYDLLDSGEGKTAKMRSLAHVIMQAQREKQDEYNRKYEEWAALPKKERGDPPPRPRGYYFTNLTIEGVHAESEGHPSGGLVAILNEASTFVGGQNEYKSGKGTDREAWLSLHDGSDARIVRATKSVLITGARVQIIGGIQPKVFRRVFGGDDKLYLYDGTIYRGLYTYSPPQHHPLTLEAWGEEHREPWDRTLRMALEWADQQDAPHTIYLNSEAQNLFLTWRNSLDREKVLLPPELRGFLPKAYGYSLRLAAVIDLMHQFYNGQPPRRLLDAEGMQRGIDAAMFYLGQAVDAMRLILGDELTADPIKARIIDALRDRGALTATKIYTDVFQKNKPARKIQGALNDLVNDGQVTASTEPTEGRPKTTYTLNVKNVFTYKAPEPGHAPDLNALNTYKHRFSGCAENQDTGLNALNTLNTSVCDLENNDEVEI